MTLPHRVRPLPARPVPLPGESLTSLLRRAARAMEYRSFRQIQDLVVTNKAVAADADCLPPGLEMKYLAALLHCETSQLAAMTVHGFAGSLVLVPEGFANPEVCDRTTIARYFAMGSHPVCPACLAQDLEPYERLVWRFQPIPMCLTHGCLLLRQCPGCGRPLRRDRPVVDQCACGTAIHDASLPPLADALVNHLRSLASWFTGKSPIPKLSVAGCFTWADYLARTMAKMHTWLETLSSDWHIPPGIPPQILRWVGAADILTHWPERFHEFLAAMQAVPGRGRHSTGTTICFGQLPVVAAKLERLGQTAPADALRDYLLERFTAGQLSIRIGVFRGRNLRELLDRRPWVAHTEAARLLGVRHATVADLVRRGVLEGQVQPAGNCRRKVGVVSRESLRRLAQDLADSLGCRQAAKQLGLFHKTVWQMAQDGLLERAVRTADGWRIPRRSLEGFLEWFRRQPSASSIGTEWLPFRQAVRRLGSSGMTVVRLLQDVRRGDIRTRRHGRHRNLDGVVVHRDDLVAAVEQAHAERLAQKGYSLREVGKVLLPERRMDFRGVKRWVRLGLLRAERKGQYWLITPEEVQRFRGEYCLAAEACRLLGISSSTLVHWRAAGKLEPIYGRDAKFQGSFSLFRRSDVLRLLPSSQEGKD